MTDNANVKNIGLRGVKVADTKISHVDGENGVLIYRGYRIEELARNSTFVETAFLLLYDELPSSTQLDEFRGKLREAGNVPAHVLESLGRLPRNAKPMDVLQAAIPLLAASDPDLESETREANLARAIRLIACVPALVAGWDRIRKGNSPVSPDNSLPHAANFLWQLTGRQPDKETARDLDTALLLHADHSFNASTFACREVASTKAHMYAAAAAGVGALSGSLHGGANAQVMKMLSALQNEKDIAAWVKKQLDSGRKIMGMGHAVYKTADPRAAFLKDMCFRLAKKLGQEHWCRLSTEIEQTAVTEFIKRGKSTIKPNVDFYSAACYHMIGIEEDLMTPIFAIARVAGWTAHIIEEKFGDAQEKPALYRPSSEYIGHYCGKTGCTYTQIKQRQ